MFVHSDTKQSYRTKSLDVPNLTQSVDLHVTFIFSISAPQSENAVSAF